MSRDWRLYVNDILQACQRARRYTAGITQAQFFADDRTFDAVIRNFEILGEAAKKLPEEIRQQMPQIEWRKIAGMRDVLAHAYFGIEAEVIWDALQNDLPALEATVAEFLRTHPAQPSPPAES